jgi:hypothetical protein
MASSLRPTDFVIEDNTNNDLLFDPTVNGNTMGRGYIPRDYKVHPVEMFDPPSEVPLIPKSEWSARIKEKVETKSQLSDIRLRHLNGQPIPALDQNGQGFCWYSTTGVVMMTRMKNHQPYVRLSAHATACMIKGFKDEGGWCGLSAERQKSHGTPSVELWPEKSMSRSNDKPEVWDNAALHKVTEDWIDITREVYERNLKFEILASLLLSNESCAVDFDWWGHSVCALDLVEVESGAFGIRILNSWTDGWGDKGMGVLKGGKEIPVGGVCLRVTGASNK